MIANLKAYESYANSTATWLGDVPTHWFTGRIKTILQESEARTLDGKGTLLSLTRSRGLIAHSERTDKVHSANSLIGYKKYLPGEIVMNRMQAWSGMFGVCDHPGLVSPDYAVFHVKGDHEVKFILERLKAPDLVGQFANESRGIGTGFNRLYSDRFGALAISLPPRSEQVSIVKFMNWANVRIEKTIRAKQKIIALLNEQIQTVVQDAVTHGVNPTVEMRPTNLSWLPEIPAHWEILRAKYLINEIDERSIDGDEILLRVSQYTGVTPRQSFDSTGMPRADSLIGYKRVKKNDLVINIMIAWNGSLAVTDYEGIVSPAYCVYRLKDKILPRFIHHLLRTKVYGARIKQASTGVIESRLRLYSDELGRIEVLLPPLPEQAAIVNLIDAETKDISSAIVCLEKQVSLLNEYKARLMNDLVTGRLDVREAALQIQDNESYLNDDIESDLNMEDFVADDEI